MEFGKAMTSARIFSAVVLFIGIGSFRGVCASSFGPAKNLGLLNDSVFSEVSGVAASRVNPNVLYVHNDGARDKVFAVRTDGALQATFDFDASIEDFEDIAVGPGPVAGVFYIYAGDIGDNGENRNTISVYWVSEPEVSAVPTQNPQSRTLKAVSQVKMKYPDGAHNAETLLCDPLTRDLYVVTKQSSHSRVYRLKEADLQATKTVTLEFVIELAMDSVSGGDISPDGSELILRREDAAFLWSRSAGQTIDSAFQNEPVAIPVVGPPTEPNGEGIAFSPSGDGYFTVSEGKDQPVYFFPRNSSVRADFASGPARIAGGWEITITGPAGAAVVVEGSSDLENWSEIGSVILSGNSITLADAADLPARFYRLLQE
jgi:hypothetical protein